MKQLRLFPRSSRSVFVGALPFNQKILKSNLALKISAKICSKILASFQRYSSEVLLYLGFWAVGTGEISVPLTEFTVSTALIKWKRSALSFGCFANFCKKPLPSQCLSNPQQTCWKNCSTHQIPHSIKWPLVSWQQQGWRLYLRVLS